jgi:anti-sigma regulatory factor (Ser/Thr protein kinase)
MGIEQEQPQGVNSTIREFPNQKESVRAARDFVADVLHPFGVDDVVPRIVTSELASNAVRHAQTPFRVAVDVNPGTIRIEVEDGKGAQKIATDMASENTGRGLRIVEDVATAWGVEHRGPRKAVWIELPSSPRKQDSGRQT